MFGHHLFLRTYKRPEPEHIHFQSHLHNVIVRKCSIPMVIDTFQLFSLDCFPAANYLNKICLLWTKKTEVATGWGRRRSSDTDTT